MLFSDLLFLLPPNLRIVVDRLLALKMNNPEIAYGAKITELNIWIEEELVNLESKISKLPADRKPGWNELNEVFVSKLSFSM